MKATLTAFGLLLLLLFPLASDAQSKYASRVDKSLAKGDTVKAIKKLNKYIDKHPEETSLFLKRAELKLERGDLEPAMADLNSYCSLSKRCGEADLLKGIIRFRQGDYNGAIAFLSSYTTEKDDPKAWAYIGRSHMWLQNYPVAINAFQRAIALNPNDVNSIYNAGLSAYYFDKYALADSLILEASKLVPQDKDIRLAYGLSLLKGGNHIESNKVFREFEEGDTHYSTALYNIGVNYYNLNEFDLACDYWERAVDQGHLKAEDSIAQYCGRRKRGGQRR